MKVISHSALARLHPTAHHHHAETEQRIAVLLERFPEYEEGVPATREQIERVHSPNYVSAIASLGEVSPEELWLDGDTLAGRLERAG